MPLYWKVVRKSVSSSENFKIKPKPEKDALLYSILRLPPWRHGRPHAKGWKTRKLLRFQRKTWQHLGCNVDTVTVKFAIHVERMCDEVATLHLNPVFGEFIAVAFYRIHAVYWIFIEWQARNWMTTDRKCVTTSSPQFLLHVFSHIFCFRTVFAPLLNFCIYHFCSHHGFLLRRPCTHRRGSAR